MESKLIKKVKPLLNQRTFNMPSLTMIDLACFTHEEKERCMQIMNREQAKIKTFLHCQANKMDSVKKQVHIYSLASQ